MYVIVRLSQEGLLRPAGNEATAKARTGGLFRDAQLPELGVGPDKSFFVGRIFSRKSRRTLSPNNAGYGPYHLICDEAEPSRNYARQHKRHSSHAIHSHP